MAKTDNKLYRSQHDRILFGVCGGLGDYFHLDPTIIRLLFVILFLINGSGLFIYLALAIITSKSPQTIDHATSALNLIKRKHFLGYLIIFVGIMILLKNFAPEPWLLISSRLVWPLIIISLGIILIFKKPNQSL